MFPSGELVAVAAFDRSGSGYQAAVPTVERTGGRRKRRTPVVGALTGVLLLAATACSGSSSAPSQATSIHPTASIHEGPATTYPAPVAPSLSVAPTGRVGVLGRVAAPASAGFTGSTRACPSSYPSAISNPPVPGLARAMVPFDARTALLCVYTDAGRRLARSARLTGTAATALARQTSSLRALNSPGNGARLPSCSPRGSTWFLLTFVRGAQRVVVTDQGCPYATNNVLSAAVTSRWRQQLEQSAGPSGAG